MPRTRKRAPSEVRERPSEYPVPGKTLFNTPETIAYLGKTDRWIRRELERRGRLYSLSIKLGKHRHWLKEDLDAWLRLAAKTPTSARRANDEPGRTTARACSDRTPTEPERSGERGAS